MHGQRGAGLVLAVLVALTSGCRGSEPGDRPDKPGPSAVEDGAAAPTKEPDEASSADVAGTEAQSAPTEPLLRHFDWVGSVSGEVVGASSEVVLTDDDGWLTTWDMSGDVLGETQQGEPCGAPVLSPGADGSVYALEQTVLPAEGLTEERTLYELVARDTELVELWRREIARPAVSPLSFDCEESDLAKVHVTLDGAGVSVMVADTSAIVSGDGSEMQEVDWTPVPVGRFWGTFDGGCPNCVSGLRSVDLVDPTSFETVQSFAEGDGAGFGAVRDVVWQDDDSAFFSDGETLVSGASDGLVTVDLLDGSVAETEIVADDDYRNGRPIVVDDEYVVVLPAGVTWPDGPLQGFDADLRPLWEQDNVERICDGRDGQVVVEGNGQLVLLDVVTGEQLDYSGDPGNCAPGSIAGGFFVSDDSGDVYRLTDELVPESD